MPNRKRVFDSVTLSNFLFTETTFVLEQRYRKHAIITHQVYDEISSGILELPKLQLIDKLIDNKQFYQVTLSQSEHKIYLSLLGHLGKGEASCIAYAQMQGAVVMTDDQAARMQCRQMNIPVSGTLGILKAAYLDRQIPLEQADEILSRMIEAGYYSPIKQISEIV